MYNQYKVITRMANAAHSTIFGKINDSKNEILIKTLF